MPDAKTLFTLLNALIPLEDLVRRGSQRFHRPGYSDLFAEVLTRRGPKSQISLAHFIIVSGVACPCPELEIEVDFEARSVRPLIIQFASGHQSRAIAVDRAGHEVVNQSVGAELGDFLAMWIRRLMAEGYTLRPETPAESWTHPAGPESPEAGGRL
jgi:hypothetical protein